MSDTILDGVTVIDLSTGIAGSVAALFLAEAGADVVKIEPPDGGAARAELGFRTWNRSKRSVLLDIDRPDDLGHLNGLLGTADVLIHDMTPTQARAIGLDDAGLADRHPALIVASATGYPVGHPDAERPGHDLLVQARIGMMDEVLAVRRNGPVPIRFPLPSWAATYLLTAGILSRLLVRDQTGRAGPVHTSLYQGAAAVLAMLWHRGDHISESMRMKMPLTKNGGPARSKFECGDGGWIQINGGFLEVPLFIETVAELGMDAMDFSYAELMASADAHQRCAPAFRRRPLAEWLEAFWAADVPAYPVQHLGELLRDSQMIANDYTVDIDDPEYGRTRQARAPFVTDPPSIVLHPAPALGAHTEEVLAEGLSGPAPVRGEQPYPASYPLEGLRVLDLGMYLAGPLAPMVLADFGADVIKLEPPRGDRMRSSELMFVGCQRNKRSIAVDLRTPEGQQVLHRLVRWADVVHHNLRMPAASRLGVDEESLRAVNADIIYCHNSAYGPKGPRKDWPGYDPTTQAASGWMWENAGVDNPPVWYRFGYMDHQCALSSLVPTLLALIHRHRTGRGTFVTASLNGAATMTNSHTLLRLDRDEVIEIPHFDPMQYGISPWHRIYPVAEGGWIAVAALTEADQVSLLQVAAVETGPEVAAAVKDRTTEELLVALAKAGVPAEEVAIDNEKAFFDRELSHPGGIVATHPHPVYGTFTQPAQFVDFGDLTSRSDLAPPTLGQHTRAILGELGYTDPEIDGLLTTGVALCSDDVF